MRSRDLPPGIEEVRRVDGTIAYRGRYRDVFQWRRSTQVFAAMDDAVTALEGERCRVQLAKRDSSAITLDEWVHHWTGPSRTEWDLYRRHIGPHLGEWTFGDLQLLRIQKWINRLAAATDGANARQCLRLLTRALDEAIECGYLTHNPCRHAAAPQPTVRRTRADDARSANLRAAMLQAFGGRPTQSR